MPLNDDPEAIPDEEYNTELEQHAADPMPKIPADQYTLIEEDDNGDPR